MVNGNLACLPAGCGTAGRCSVPPPLSTAKPIGAEVPIDAVLVCGWCGACTASAALRGEVVVEDKDFDSKLIEPYFRKKADDEEKAVEVDKTIAPPPAVEVKKGAPVSYVPGPLDSDLG